MVSDDTWELIDDFSVWIGADAIFEKDAKLGDSEYTTLATKFEKISFMLTEKPSDLIETFKATPETKKEIARQVDQDTNTGCWIAGILIPTITLIVTYAAEGKEASWTALILTPVVCLVLYLIIWCCLVDDKGRLKK